MIKRNEAYTASILLMLVLIYLVIEDLIAAVNRTRVIVLRGIAGGMIPVIDAKAEVVEEKEKV